ncbi:hypothetical protein QTP88_003934 [Uroleucon formosanum]
MDIDGRMRTQGETEHTADYFYDKLRLCLSLQLIFAEIRDQIILESGRLFDLRRSQSVVVTKSKPELDEDTHSGTGSEVMPRRIRKRPAWHRDYRVDMSLYNYRSCSTGWPGWPHCAAFLWFSRNGCSLYFLSECCFSFCSDPRFRQLHFDSIFNDRRATEILTTPPRRHDDVPDADDTNNGATSFSATIRIS